MLIGIKCNERNCNVTFDQCYECAKTMQNPCQYTEPIVMEIIGWVENRKFLSATSILGCARKLYLERKTEFYESLDEMYYRWRGQLCHHILEIAGDKKKHIIEQRFKRTIDGMEISAKPDIIIPEAFMIQDYKSCEKLPQYSRPYKNHTAQLNIYKWITEPALKEKFGNDFEIKYLEDVYISMNGTKRSRAIIWSNQETEDFIRPRLKVINDAINNDVMPDKCGAEHSWLCTGYCGVKDICDKYYMNQLEDKVRKELQMPARVGDSTFKLEQEVIKVDKKTRAKKKK